MKSISSKDLIISEVLNEPKISVDCLFLNNDKPIIIPRKRVKTSGGIVVEGELTNDHEIIDIVKEIGKKCLYLILLIFNLCMIINLNLKL